MSTETTQSATEKLPKRSPAPLQAGAGIGRAADDLQGPVAVADIHFGEGEAVGVGVPAAFQHFAHHDAFQAALNGFDLLHAFHLQPDAGEDFGKFIGAEGYIEVLF